MIGQVAPRITINPQTLAERILDAVADAGYGEFDGIIPETAEALAAMPRAISRNARRRSGRSPTMAQYLRMRVLSQRFGKNMAANTGSGPWWTAKRPRCFCEASN